MAGRFAAPQYVIKSRLKAAAPKAFGARPSASMEECMSLGNKAALAGVEVVAGNGLLHRRALLGGGIIFAGAMTAGAAGSLTAAAAEPLTDDPWSKGPGTVTPVLQQRSRFEDKVVRTLSNPDGAPRTQHARAPLHLLNGTVTPNPLHFTILHTGIPDIDPDKHR